MPRWLEQWISDEDERPLDCPFLLHNIARRQTGETRIFGTTWPVRAVADTTRLHASFQEQQFQASEDDLQDANRVP